MASLQPTLTDPDKLGLLIQCRQKMDELNTKQLNEYAYSTLQLLSTQQLKSLIFVGLNSIKNDISYNQLFKMRSSINQIIEQAKKLKNKKKPKSEDKKPLILIPIIPKNASLTKIIPFDIISNNICHFLKMSSITKLAQCDRKLAIICHTPTSITNLMHRYDSYQYVETQDDIMIDGYYESVRDCNLSNLHRFKNVERLSIELKYLASNKIKKLNLFGRVKYLSFFDVKSYSVWYRYPFNEMKLMTNLKSISFINTTSIIDILYLLKRYKTNNASHPYYNQIIYQLRSIVFIDCDFSENLEDFVVRHDNNDDIFSEYKNLLHFLLPAQPNNLQVVKFENSYFAKTDHPECKEANVAFKNIERIKTSLLNLKGFVFAESEYEEDDNLYFSLTGNILSNLIYFKYLKSIHTHSTDGGLLSLYLNNNNNNINALNKVTELCISISMNQKSTLLRNIKTFVPNLEKLCLVINISETLNILYFEKIMESIFGNQTKLKLFQIVIIIKDDENMDTKFCAKKLNILSESIKKLIKLLKSLRNHFNSKHSLLFKFHVKSSHSELSDAKCYIYNSVEVQTFADMIQTLIIHYLITYPLGKIQFKYSWDNHSHNNIWTMFANCMDGLDGLFKASVKSGGCLIHLSDEIDQVCHNDMDFNQYAISITKKNIVDEGVEYENKWNVDCRYCCNTPWV